MIEHLIHIFYTILYYTICISVLVFTIWGITMIIYYSIGIAKQGIFFTAIKNSKRQIKRREKYLRKHSCSDEEIKKLNDTIKEHKELLEIYNRNLFTTSWHKRFNANNLTK